MVSFLGINIINKFSFYPSNESDLNGQNLPLYASEKPIITSDGETLQNIYLEHSDRTKKHPLIIYFHGNSGNLFDRFDWARKLYYMNHNVLLVSYRGYSKSTGKPSELGIYIDGESALDYAISTLGYKEEEITIFGRSLGTTVAVHIAQQRQLHGVILITPLTSGQSMAKVMGLSFLKFLARNSYNSIKKINNIKTKILIIHGDKDKVIPIRMGKRMFNTFKGRKEMKIIKNGNHGNLQDVSPDLFWDSIKSFLTSQ